ncbi:MAG: hypothetical protein JRI23_29390 [Deltaproteobacteria bacterium]|jgi:cytochrome c553|nr:hypothetical protein [Deltaproteobacteria bacterium]MBW2536267.1 hypothetical protein [Deltaproteobacteria bacterium]
MMETKMRYLTIGLLPLLVACGSHYSTQEAYAACEDVRERVATTPDDAFATCVACHEDCGDECEQVTAEEGFFACPED